MARREARRAEDQQGRGGMRATVGMKTAAGKKMPSASSLGRWRAKGVACRVRNQAASSSLLPRRGAARRVD